MRATMTPYERDLIFAVADDNNEALMPIYLIRRTCQIAKQADFVAVMNWFYKSKITGNTFVHWFKEKHGAVNALAHARKSILKDLEAKAVYSRRIN